MRTDADVPNTNLVKLSAAVAALALALPCAASAADAPSADPAAAAPTPAAPSPGGLSFDDPTAPTVFADGSTLAAPLGELVGTAVALHGAVAGSHPGDAVQIQRLDPVAGWVTVATATVAPDGSYDASWTTDRAGRTSIRATPAAQATAATRAIAADAGAVEGRAITVYRRAKVTWYGPGFYGRKTACGRRMSKRLLGVANKTLPCGTLVDLYNNGRTVTVPVVDRGPFRRGTNYDLTAATAQALGVTATATIGAVRSATPAVAAAPVTASAAAR
jgi:rare lipoprotein A